MKELTFRVQLSLKSSEFAPLLNLAKTIGR